MAGIGVDDVENTGARKLLSCLFNQFLTHFH
jgi:hypothetical protein